MGVREDKLKME